MKIVNTDNFDGDYPNEHVVASYIKDERFARCMCDALNQRYSGSDAPRYFKVEDDDYVLRPGFEP